MPRRLAQLGDPDAFHDGQVQPDLFDADVGDGAPGQGTGTAGGAVVGVELPTGGGRGPLDLRQLLGEVVPQVVLRAGAAYSPVPQSW